MKHLTNHDANEGSAEWWERECPGQFLYVIRFGPEPRRRRRRKQPTPIIPWTPPAATRATAPVAAAVPREHPVLVKQREPA